jgi:hypothetical protein
MCEPKKYAGKNFTFKFKGGVTRGYFDCCGRPWFLSGDVAKALGVPVTARRALAGVPMGCQSMTTVEGPEGPAAECVIAQDGLYFLLGAINSSRGDSLALEYFLELCCAHGIDTLIKSALGREMVNYGQELAPSTVAAVAAYEAERGEPAGRLSSAEPVVQNIPRESALTAAKLYGESAEWAARDEREGIAASVKRERAESAMAVELGNSRAAMAGLRKELDEAKDNGAAEAKSRGILALVLEETKDELVEERAAREDAEKALAEERQMREKAESALLEERGKRTTADLARGSEMDRRKAAENDLKKLARELDEARAELAGRDSDDVRLAEAFERSKGKAAEKVAARLRRAAEEKAAEAEAAISALAEERERRKKAERELIKELDVCEDAQKDLAYYRGEFERELADERARRDKAERALARALAENPPEGGKPEAEGRMLDMTPVFPHTTAPLEDGMVLRDYFAAGIMPAIKAETVEKLAAHAYRIADAMMAARSNKQGA